MSAHDDPRARAPGKNSTGFHFTDHIWRLCHDMTRRVPNLGHVDMSRVAVSFTQTRSAVQHGIYATLTPMRFAGGQLHTIRRGKQWGVQRLYDTSGREMLYILRFYLPRFLDLPFRQKLITTAHELWHISPRFDGDLRRFAGRCYAHSASKENYDAQATVFVDDYLATNPPESLYAFLRDSFRDLTVRHGRVFGTKIPAPKLIRL